VGRINGCKAFDADGDQNDKYDIEQVGAEHERPEWNSWRRGFDSRCKTKVTSRHIARTSFVPPMKKQAACVNGRRRLRVQK
jgi:hypothetical protein